MNNSLFVADHSQNNKKYECPRQDITQYCAAEVEYLHFCFFFLISSFNDPQRRKYEEYHHDDFITKNVRKVV